MSIIHQMYCTHCTHGSSALEQRQGELAARMLGYSVRAGSLAGDALRQAYRQVERYVSYHLPQDTPGEEKLCLTAETAPRRLVFVPAAGPWQVIGQVCYRQRDTEGRPGSYFAHLLCRDAADGQQPWSLLDALRLWNAPGWVEEDSPDHAFLLPAIDDSEALLAGKAPAIDDRALVAFLQGADDPADLRLPDRWQDVPSATRVEVLRGMLSALLVTGTARRQTVLAAVEPAAAALLFYGVGRLLPPGTLRSGVSMSTFEASTDRLTTVLAATTFCNPATAEFRTESLRGRGVAMTTFRSPEDEPGEVAGRYAGAMIRRLLDEGPESVDRRLAMIAAASPKRIEALEEFSETEQSVAALFASAEVAGNNVWRSDAALTDFARRLVWERLGVVSAPESSLGGLCGSSNHETILELATTAPPGGVMDPSIRFLLQRLPDEQVAPLITNGEIDDGWKVEILSARFASTGRTPPGCEWIWNQSFREPPLEPERRDAVTTKAIACLSAEAVIALLANLGASRRPAVVERLMEGCSQDPARWAVFGDVVLRLDVPSLIALERHLGSRLFEVPGPVGQVISGRLQEVLNSLPEQTGEFSQRMELLEAGRKWLTDAGDRRRLEAWVNCRKTIVELASVEQAGGGWHRMTIVRRLEGAAQRMAEAALVAMPAERLEDDRQGSEKEKCLRAIGRHLLNGKTFLPETHWQNEAIWKKIRWRFEMGSWPSIPLWKLARGPADRKQMWISVGIAAAVVLGALAVIGLATIGTGPRKSESLVVERGDEPVHFQAERDGVSDGALAAEPALQVDADSDADEPVPESMVLEPELPVPEGVPGKETVAEASLPEEMLVPVDGEFAADVSPASNLEQPVVALAALRVRGVGGEALPEWVSQRYTIGAAVREQSEVRPARHLDLPDLSARNEAELFDGVETVLIQFRFVQKADHSALEPSGVVLVSRSWAEIPIEAAQRYEVRFALSRSAAEELERLAGLRRQ